MKLNQTSILAFLVLARSLEGFTVPRTSTTSVRSHHDIHFVSKSKSLYQLYSSISDDKAKDAGQKETVDPLVQKGEENIIASFQDPTSSSKILTDPIPYSELTIGVMKETFPGENRVSITPDSVEMLVKAGFNVIVQAGAGEKASFSDAAYVEKGAIIYSGQDLMFANADIITKIRPPTDDEVPKLAGKTLISMISPSINTELYESLAANKCTTFALDCVPRMLSRAQAYDVLSSQANIAGYRAMIEAADNFPKFFAGQMTAAGKVVSILFSTLIYSCLTSELRTILIIVNSLF